MSLKLKKKLNTENTKTLPKFFIRKKKVESKEFKKFSKNVQSIMIYLEYLAKKLLTFINL